MHPIYIMFYEQHTRKLHKDHIKEMDLALHPYVSFEDPYYILNPDILIGRLDRKQTFGFLRQEPKDVYIEGSELSDAMHDDIVLVQTYVEPRVVSVVQRALKILNATVKKNRKDHLYFSPDAYLDRRLFVDPYDGLVEGHVVQLEVETIDASGVYAHVKHIIGHVNDPDIDTLRIVSSYEWPEKFSDGVMASLKDIHIDMEQELKSRLDLRDELIITIDGLDAKDLDDAISLKEVNGFYELGVHIADVSTYVKPGTLLDDAAYERATSVYLADRVIPMLPHLLSNDYCSLNAHEPKLTLSCLMTLDQDGNVVHHKIAKTVIESNRRMNYHEVNEFLKKGKSLKDKTIEKMIITMNELSQKLALLRKQRGEIEFESTELKFIVDEQGKVKDVVERHQEAAEELIESFMLIANETVAKHMFDADLPSLYRIHEKPDVVKLKTALLTVAKLGFHPNMRHVGEAKTLQHITTKSVNTPYGPIVHMLLLRAMQKAKYSEIRDIHFGLGATYYTHFTSPIRRYPDLMVHRLIHLLVLGEANNPEKTSDHYSDIMPDVAKHTSDQERSAIQLERDVAKLKSCEYLQDKVGEKNKATITQMMPTGMFVQLENGIEGFVPLRVLDDYYMYNDDLLTFFGKRGKKYKLGDQVTVELLSVDMTTRKVDFGIIGKKRPNKQYQKPKYNRPKIKVSKKRK